MLCSCLISKNLFFGCKTCKEVAIYMHYEMSILDVSEDQKGKFNEISSKPRRHKKKLKHKRLKISSKSAGVSSVWKQMTNGKEKYIPYTPCECEGVCGKKCSCVNNGFCCEKYCGYVNYHSVIVLFNKYYYCENSLDRVISC